LPSIRNQSARNVLFLRINALTPNAKPRWGKLDAPAMICHLGDTLAMALGDLPVKPGKQGPLHYFPLKHLILYVLPIPKNVQTATELLSTPQGNFDNDRQRVIEQIMRLAKQPRSMGPVHPHFGPLTNEEWNVLQWKHTHHHLKQFGI
jgi:hypothetical protein